MLRDCKAPALIVFIVLLMVDGLVIQGGVGGGNGGHDRGPDDRKMA